MNSILRERLKKYKIDRGYYKAPITDLMNFEYKFQTESCPHCKELKNSFILPPWGEYNLICTDCVKTAKLKFSHECRYGIVSNEETPDFIPDEFNVKLHMPDEAISKLLNTPEFSSIQGEIWLDHCNDFMNFIGVWSPKDFTDNSKTNGKDLFMSMTENEYNHLWDLYELDKNEVNNTWTDAQYYTFQCTKCEKHAGYWDMS